LPDPVKMRNRLRSREYWTLELLDFHETYERCFVVQQASGRWSDLDRAFMFEQMETDRLPLLIDAKAKYEVRRLALMEKGFTHSDMDF
jgi:hypothetical protein